MRETHPSPSAPEPQAGRAPVQRRLGEGADWCVGEYVCSAGPGDRAYEERHDWFTIAAVLEGSFSYVTDNGSTLLYPGALLLGNAGACFECGHEHARGDRCIAVHVASECFAEVAAGAGAGAAFKFAASALPASARTAVWVAQLAARLTRHDPLAAEEDVLRLLELVIATFADRPPTLARHSARDARRISDALRTIEQTSAEPLDLEQLAAVARMSKYHFLRTFRRVVGVTPYQHLLQTRMHRAALALLTTQAPIAAVAFEAGFGDLSTFNASFRQRFGQTPRAFREHERTRLRP
jgi:AraC-like DNA-binding protein